MIPPLKLTNVSKSFPNVKALDDVSITLGKNEILGLIGQNGSGKSTLMKIVYGIYLPDAGNVQVHGKDVRLSSPLAASLQGIGMVHQEQSLIPNLTVAENIFLNRPDPSRRFGIYKWRSLNRRAKEYLEKLSIDVRPDVPVETLTFAQRQMVELAKVLSMEETGQQEMIILFDEATAIMNRTEIDVLFQQIRRINSRASVIFVSHRMDEVLEISDRIYVLSDGKVVAERLKSETEADELYTLMVGEQRAAHHGNKRRTVSSPSGETSLSVANLTVPGHVKSVSFELRRGEIVGMIGVHGSGAEQLCRALFGLEEAVSGEIALLGRPVDIDHPREAVRLGIGYVPAERKLEGAALDLSVADNMALVFGKKLGWGEMLLNTSRERSVVGEWVKRLKVKAPNIDVSIGSLSGGNQQKAVLGKWLISPQVRILVLDHPTRGLDPGARADLFATVRELAETGVSILFVADTLDEVLILSDRILVMRDGEITGHFDDIATRPPSEEVLVKAMV